MQWKNKLHELDTVANKLSERQEQLKHIYIFGAGLVGSQVMATLCEYGILAGFIDNDERKQQTGYKGYQVCSLKEYLMHRNGVIVVAVGVKILPTILHQLANEHLLEGKDFYLHTEFFDRIFPIISVYFYNKSYVSLAQISLTERCTLKCKKCAHGCFAVNNSTAKDLTLEQVKKSADSFFCKVDFIQEFVLIAGNRSFISSWRKRLPISKSGIETRWGFFLSQQMGQSFPTKKYCIYVGSIVYSSVYQITALPFHSWKRLTES